MNTDFLNPNEVMRAVSDDNPTLEFHYGHSVSLSMASGLI